MTRNEIGHSPTRPDRDHTRLNPCLKLTQVNNSGSKKKTNGVQVFHHLPPHFSSRSRATAEETSSSAVVLLCSASNRFFGTEYRN